MAPPQTCFARIAFPVPSSVVEVLDKVPVVLVVLIIPRQKQLVIAFVLEWEEDFML